MRLTVMQAQHASHLGGERRVACVHRVQLGVRARGDVALAAACDYRRVAQWLGVRGKERLCAKQLACNTTREAAMPPPPTDWGIRDHQLQEGWALRW